MSRINVMLAVGASAALIAACSSSGGASTDSTTAGGGTTNSHRPSPPAQTSATASESSSHSASASALSGTWDGKYSGAFTGTFVLRWAQAGSKLSGTINLSTAGGTLPIHGTVSGDSIQFGTVGSEAITYTGAVSGGSMSGSYQVAGGAGGSGTWSANKM
jgi:hypothetical protein